MNLGGGVALRVASEELDAIRAEIAERLRGLLTAQDSAGWYGMAGCSSGRLHYVVVSKGGVGGVGETLHRLPWGAAKVEADRLILDCVDELKEITGKEWPVC